MCKNDTLLVYRYGGIGDTLTLAPFLESLRTRFHEIILLGAAERLELLEETLRDRVLSYDLHSRRLPELLREATLSVAFSTAPMPGFARSFPPFPPERVNIYDWMRERARELGGDAAMPARNPIREGRGVVVHPGSSSPSKTADPAPLYAAAQAELHEGEKALILLGPSDADRLAEKSPGFEVRRPDSLSELRAMLAGSRLFLGNDSGPAHLAAHLGLRTIVRFVASDPVVWLPPGATRWESGFVPPTERDSRR